MTDLVGFKYVFQCSCCGADFGAKRRDTRFCSESCGDKLRSRQWRARNPDKKSTAAVIIHREKFGRKPDVYRPEKARAYRDGYRKENPYYSTEAVRAHRARAASSIELAKAAQIAKELLNV
ncbi:hypothetical protein [Rhizobium phage RHph_X2_26]|nr:hypothetical protein [Rhizobium phage RHph_X2_26]